MDESDWHRPDVDSMNEEKDSIAIQQLETDYYVTTPVPPRVPPGVKAAIQREAIIRIFGVNEKGNSVVFHVHGFKPYFFIAAWSNLTQEHINEFAEALNAKLKEDARERTLQRAVLSVEPLLLQSVWGYQFGERRTFLKVTVAVPSLVATARRLLERGQIVGREFLTYESNVPYVLRFMIDHKMAGGSWVEAPAGSYSIRAESECETLAQVEIDIHYKDIIGHDSVGKYLQLAPLRVLSFDIECAGRKGHFPVPEIDPVIQIASVVAMSSNLNKPIYKTVHTLNTCSSIAGAVVVSNPTEKELLMSWQQFFHEADPDVIIGYNVSNFDWPYLLDRAKALKLPDFPYFGRVNGVETRVKKTTFASRQVGKQENKEMNIEGRVQFDVLLALRRDYKLRSYTLNAVSAEFLKQQKEDVHHSIITDLQNGDDETRKRLAEYCLKDALLPLRLMQKLMLWINYVEMARVTGVPINYLLTRGQSIKVISQILRKAKQHGMVVPVFGKKESSDKYDGATVLEPDRGYYTDPVATLDFASLYPSIMMAHNLCYTSLISPTDARKLDPSQYTLTPHGDYFVKPELQKGILPEILEELLKARKVAKKDMAAATDPLTKAVLNGRQLALKISANSVYGFTGAQVGQLPCLAISSSVTSYGRVMLEHTKATVERIYTRANGYEHDAHVVYGDTDSVMVKFGTSDLKEAMRLGQEAAVLVSKEFISPIKLEFEKVYWPFLLMNKKRYAGLYWTNTVKWDKIDTKGIETVRRDNCALVKNVVTECLNMLLVRRSPQLAINYAKQTISQLLCNKLDLSLLVISKSLGKGASAEDYAAKQAHVELAERMRKRDPTSAPAVGDRVPYVIIKSSKGAANYEKSEDPIWVLEKNIPIDTDYYLNNQLKNPLKRIFEPILHDRVNELFEGDHTLKVKIATGGGSAGAILKFAQKTATCIGCRAALPPGRRNLCAHCEPRRGELYVEKMNAVRENEEIFAKLWSQCQRCQMSLHHEVLCTSRDCPIFYRRKKVQIDLQEASETLSKLSEDDF